MVPRPVVVLIVIVLTGLLVVDVLVLTLAVPGHAASPVLDGAILAVLGGVVAASRGPKPPDASPPPTDDPPPPPPAVDGRHRAPGAP